LSRRARLLARTTYAARQVELVDAIPRSPSGKILRRLLAEKNQA
jgi:acyl-coenzyme A synthetase/AMP-(fatty) acid ligase